MNKRKIKALEAKGYKIYTESLVGLFGATEEECAEAKRIADAIMEENKLGIANG
jgi:hypothetical protein